MTLTEALETSMSAAATAKAEAKARTCPTLRRLCHAALTERIETRWHDTGTSTKSGRVIAELTGTAGPAELALAEHLTTHHS